jgi:Fe-S cluster biogenesis protein NfuA
VSNTRAVGDRIEQLIAEMGSLGDPRAREGARELVQLLMEFYGAGLERIVQVATEAGHDALLHRLADEPLVAALLLLHNLHPVDARTRVEGALSALGPQLAAHGAEVELTRLEDGVAHVRLQIGGHGCGSTAVALKDAIEQALAEAAPELAGIDIDVNEPAAPLIQIQLSRPPARPPESDAAAR